MLVNHVRDAKGRAFATVVAIDYRQVGAAVCNAKDVFRKKQGIAIATGRAKAGTKPTMLTDSKKAWLVANAVSKMMIRSQRFFGEKKDVKTPKGFGKVPMIPKRKRGRPLGSKNKVKAKKK